MVTKRMVLLANSRKLGGRCLAGREIHAQAWGDWLRPVSAQPGEALTPRERQYTDQSEPAVLDIIDVPLIRANPHSCQSENWLVSAPDWWVKRGQLTWEQAAALAEAPQRLWVCGRSSGNGQNDEMPKHVAEAQPNSLYLIRVPRVDIKVFTPWDKKKVRAEFVHQAVRYNLSLTDCVYEPMFLARDEGNYFYTDCLLTISISEPLRKNDGGEYQHKLVAALLPNPNP